jgi:hypothetical protein
VVCQGRCGWYWEKGSGGWGGASSVGILRFAQDDSKNWLAGSRAVHRWGNTNARAGRERYIGGQVRTKFVYTILVKNITLSADENLIEEARRAAAEQHTTLNAAFREWLEQFSGRARRAREFDEFFARTQKYFTVDRKYTRDELNER